MMANLGRGVNSRSCVEARLGGPGDNGYTQGVRCQISGYICDDSGAQRHRRRCGCLDEQHGFHGFEWINTDYTEGSATGVIKTAR